QERAFGCAIAHTAEVTDFTKSRAEQQAQRFLILELAHVEAKQLSRAEHLSCRYDHRFRFANARWPEQQKTSARTRGLREAEFTASYGGNDSRQRVGLAADLARKEGVQFVELRELRRVCGFVHPPVLARTARACCVGHTPPIRAVVRWSSSVRRKG